MPTHRRTTGNRAKAMIGRIVTTLSAGIAYWYSVSLVVGVIEPWDADGFWRLWYPVALFLSAAAGFVFGKRSWLAGLLIVFAQTPVLGRNCGVGGSCGQMWAAGLVMLGLLALPAAAVSALAGRMASRSSHAD